MKKTLTPTKAKPTIVKPAVVKVVEQRSVRTESGEVFIIQKNIPVSSTYRSLGPNLRYPFSSMASGESFEIKVGKSDMKKAVSRVSAACTSYSKRNNHASKFVVRRTAPDTVRVWRIR